MSNANIYLYDLPETGETFRGEPVMRVCTLGKNIYIFTPSATYRGRKMNWWQRKLRVLGKAYNFWRGGSAE